MLETRRFLIAGKNMCLACFQFFTVGLEISYTLDLDRIKAVSGSNSFRRMFFVDEVTKNKVFVISGVHNLTKQGNNYCSSPKTVYLKVCVCSGSYRCFSDSF